MEPPKSVRPVLVGVERLDHVQQLVRTAGDLASLGSGTVRLVTVAVKGSDSPFSVFDDETIVREFAEPSHELLSRARTPAGVTVERDVLVARSAAAGLLAAVEETDPDALVVGWRESSGPTDAVFGTTVDTLVERAPCDLYVERVGREANGVDAVLLAVAGGPHVAAAARVAAAVADRNDARVLVYSADTGEGDAEAFVETGRAAVADAAPGVAVETAVESRDDPTDAVVEAAADVDVVVLSATRSGALRRKLVGSLPRRVVKRTDRTVVIARSGDAVGGLLHRLGGLFRR